MAPIPADSLFIKAFGGNKQTTNSCNNVPAKAMTRKKAANRWLYTKQVLQYSKKSSYFLEMFYDEDNV